ncbi:MAG: IS21-like element helper ATPase IstB [Methylobacter sp.]
MLPDALRRRAEDLHFYGLLAHGSEIEDSAWVEKLLDWEEAERARRSLVRRLRGAHIGRFKPLADFDWNWPEHCDRLAITELMSLEFLKTATNAILVGASGFGKSTIAQNIAHQAVLNGQTALFTSAGQLLSDLAALDSDSALRRRLRYYAAPSLLVIDEVGYLSYSNRHADLLFELINRRHEQKSTLITTNKSFAEWSDVFPNAACVVALIDRLVHNAEIIAIKGKSYRQKEAQERAEQRSKKRKASTSGSSE